MKAFKAGRSSGTSLPPSSKAYRKLKEAPKGLKVIKS